MFKIDYSVFFGRQDQFFETCFLAENNIFLILEGENGNQKKDYQILIKSIKTIFEEKKPNTLDQINKIIEELIKKEERKITSFSFGFLTNEGIFYLKTAGNGEILICREGKLNPLIKGEKTASGFVQNGDFFIFTHKRLLDLIELKQWEKEFYTNSAKEILEKLTPLIKEKDDKGTIALFFRFFQEAKTENKDIITEEESKNALETKENWLLKGKRRFKKFFSHLSQRFLFNQQIKTGKKITLFLIFVLLVLFVWSVVFGYQRREQERITKQINETKKIIDNKLNEALDLSTINLNRSLILISEAKNELKNLKNSLKGKDHQDLIILEKFITEKEKEIMKKEEKKGEEFYDLKLINNQAKGERLYLEGETMVVLNSVAREIYLISLTKKSQKTIKEDEIKEAALVAFYNENTFFFNSKKGLYKIGRDNKKILVVNQDDQWGEIIDFWIYNGNLYLLDKEKDEIYKYLVTESGYSAKSSYFKTGQSIDLSEINSMAIDSSIYLAGDNLVFKYTNGIRDDFKVDLPNKESLKIKKIFTNKNTNKIYLWDKEKGVVYLVNKQGKYEKQINSSFFKKAADLTVFEKEGILILINDKIFRFSLD